MPRSMREVNEEVFNNLKEKLRENGHDEFQDKICIYTQSNEKHWLQNAVFSKTEGANSVNIARGTNDTSFTEVFLDNERYIIIDSDFEYDLDPELFEFIPQNAGIFTLCLWIDFLDIENASELYEFYLYREDDTLRSLDYNYLSQYFSSYSIIRVKSDLIIDSSLEAIGCILISEKAREEAKYSESFIRHIYPRLISLSINSQQRVPFDVILSGASNFNYPKSLFLDLYRSLERVFSHFYMEKLKNELSLDIENDELVGHIENITGWRPHEESSIIKLLKSLDNEDINTCFQILSSTSLNTGEESIGSDEAAIASLKTDLSEKSQESEEYKKLSENIDTLEKDLIEKKVRILGKRIYKVRNSLVHYRSALDGTIKELDDIFKLNGLLCIIVEKVYGSIVEQ